MPNGTQGVRRGNGTKAIGLRRVLGFKELFFASLGGQSPFLSILTYGTATIIYAQLLAPIAALVGTLMVLINGLVVYQLSRRISRVGGYYTYAQYFISHRVGIETGLIYLFYSILYGSAYAIGAAGLAWYFFRVNFHIMLAAILVIMFVLAVLGIKPSARYAVFAGSLEIAVLIAIGLALLYLSGFRLNLGFSTSGISPTAFGYAVLLAAAIPTGYGTITPLSGEAKGARRVVPKAIVSVILAGGLLAAFDIFAFEAAGVRLMGGVGGLLKFLGSYLQNSEALTSPMLYILHKYFGILVDIPILIALINDGVLGVLAYSLASSRVIYAMALDGYAPRIFSRINVNTNNPTMAALASSIGIIIVSILAVTLTKSPFMAFIVLGSLSTMAGLIVHLVSNVSLMRMAVMRRYVRRMKLGLISLASAATLMVVYSVASTVVSLNPVYVEIFLAWIILSFIYVEALSIAMEEAEEGE